MKKFTYILLLLFTAFFSQAQDRSMEGIIKTPPNPPKLVNDYADILTSDQKQALESKLVRFDDSTSTQVTVVIVPSLDGMDVADAATELGRSWGVGGKASNNGVVLLVSAKDRKLNISPGYGLEKVLTDLTTQQIIQQIIVPNFKGNDYYRGIDEGTNAIIAASRGEYNVARSPGRGGNTSFGKILFIVIIIFVVLAFSGRGGGGGSFMSRRGSRGLAETLFWTSFLGGGRGGGGGGGFSGGGSGGGGFGGFGGGSFGGGGSSGSW